MENLKPVFYQLVKKEMSREMEISNIGIQKEFEKIVLHLEPIMTHLRIINQFKLALEKWSEETGIVTTHHYIDIENFIISQPKNY